jgi:putative phosphotransacetylase
MKEDHLANLIEQIVRDTLNGYMISVKNHTGDPVDMKIPIAVSNRHVHLSPAAVERLFGYGYELTKLKDLSQPGQYACNETVTLIGPKGRIDDVRILGPARGDTQVEISLYDGYKLGVRPPIRNSGDLDGTPGIKIQGPKGQAGIEKGVICAARHIHMHPDDAKKYGVENGQRVKVQVGGMRGLIMDQVLIRISEKYRLDMHIDIDEANAGNIANGHTGLLIK